ncbi:MAG: protein kinase [Candidatus Schekmanbacteria bacterium]|nr:protein kinase [Candidatus Schekmanbacteria bacterium]
MGSPERIGHYRIDGVLGSGGMGVVYHGTDERSGERVAIKTVRAQRQRSLSALRREILALASLQHPGIVHIVGHGVLEGAPWYAMELIEGVTLREHFGGLKPVAPRVAGTWVAGGEPTTEGAELGSRETDAVDATGPASTTTSVHPAATPMGSTVISPRALAGDNEARSATWDNRLGSPPPEAAPLPRSQAAGGQLTAVLTQVRRLCVPLAYLHGEGIVHRDLKPVNIIIRPNGLPVIVDFGLWTRFSGDAGREAFEVDASIAGTADYMAPEQIRGELIDARTDLYALGCILYELITGTPPFRHLPTASVLEAHLRRVPLLPSTFAQGVPHALDKLVLRLLEKDQARRIGYAQDVGAALAELGAGDAGFADAPRPRTYLYRPAFVSRQAELSELEERLAGAAAGQGGALLLGGETGVGKTRLAMEAGHAAAAMAIDILDGACGGGGAAGRQALEPFQRPLRLLGDWCRESGGDAAQRIFGLRGKVLNPYEPSLRSLAGQEALAEPVALPVREAHDRLFRAVWETFAAAAEVAGHPILLVLEDLQWADDLSLGAVAHALRHEVARDRALMVLATYRTDEPGPALRAIVEAPGVDTLRLAALDTRAIAAMVAGMLAMDRLPESFSGYLNRHAEGNPFFVAEYLRAAVAANVLWRDELGAWRLEARAEHSGAVRGEDWNLPLPTSLRELLGRRLADLSLVELGVLRAAAVFDAAVPPVLLQRVSGGDDDAVLGAVNALVQRGILAEAERGELHFSHAKVRQVAYEGMATGERVAAHRAAALGIEEVCGAELEEHLARLAEHWRAAGVVERALPYYLRAARREVARYAHDAAEGLYRAFLSLAPAPGPESIEARTELADKVLSHTGRNDEALCELDVALAEADGLRDGAAEDGGAVPVRLVRARVGALLARWTVCYITGNVPAAYEAVNEAHELARSGGDEMLDLLASVLDRLGVLDLITDPVAALARHRAAYELAARLGDPATKLHALGNWAIAAHQSGAENEAVSLFERHATECREVADPARLATALNNLGRLLLERESFMNAETHLREALSLQEAVQNRLGQAYACFNLGQCLDAQGVTTEAAQHLAAAVELFGAAGATDLRGMGLSRLAEAACSRGDTEQALMIVARALADTTMGGNEEDVAEARVIEARCLLAGGRVGKVMETLSDEKLADWSRVSLRAWSEAHCLLQEVAYRQGDLGSSLAAFGRLENSQPGSIPTIIAARAHALAAWAQLHLGHRDVARTELGQADELLRRAQNSIAPERLAGFLAKPAVSFVVELRDRVARDLGMAPE